MSAEPADRGRGAGARRAAAAGQPREAAQHVQAAGGAPGPRRRADPALADDAAQALMLAFQRGEPGAFEELVRLVSPSVFALGYRYGLDAAAAEDLVQETLLRVYRARRRYRPEARFSAWLLRIATNVIISAARQRKRRPTVKLQGAGAVSNEGDPPLADERTPGPPERLQADERAAKVREALAELPASQRTALVLNRFHGLSYDEVAQALGLGVPAVKSLLFRARHNLKRRLERFMEP
ncbi:MAG: RNA polymerase sigma factor [Planctomycetota bacterium]|nr:MAG: RNA polymerase sigma factor [Planctomycetota bacterium]